MDPGESVVWQLRQRWDADNHEHVHRWEPWVRSYLCGQILNSNLNFEVTADKPPEGGKLSYARLQVTLSTWLPDMKSRHNLVTLVRPPETAFHEQVKRVLAWADLREERIPEILTQIGNTYAFWGALIPLHTERMRRTREVLDAAVQFAMFVEMRFKHELACWRPADYSPQVQPMVSTPGHGILPSGHCVEAYVIKEVLEALLGLTAPDGDAESQLHAQFERTAARIATNRVVAGVHFPIDNMAGRLLGTVLGRYFVFFCEGARAPSSEFLGPTRTFRGDTCPEDVEFDPQGQDLDDLPGIYESGAKDFPDIAVQASVLTELWKSARDELKRLQLPFR